jgi:dTDP-4-dehydrorhamnose 3,5-epimerase
LGTTKLDKILITPLARISNANGDILHAMKKGDPGFHGFGEVYFSIIHGGAIKAWKRHIRMTLNLVVPFGDVEFIFSDDQGNFRIENIGQKRYVRLTVPPGIWFGFMGLNYPHSILMNCADIPHEPREIERKQLDEMPYTWSAK